MRSLAALGTSRRTGMTLMELTVALSITGMAITGGYSAFATLADRREGAARTTSAMQRDAAARASLVAWVSSARLTIEEDDVVFRAVDGAARVGTSTVADDDVAFYTTAPTPVGRDGAMVRLFIDRSDRTPERGLVAEVTEFETRRVVRVELVPNAAALDGSFLSGIFGQRQWVGSWVSTSVLPAGARLSFGAAPGDSLSPLWRVPLTVSIEGGR
jgi:prepilin-type N-terminal cleavage/methylation domain-containing protein